MFLYSLIAALKETAAALSDSETEAADTETMAVASKATVDSLLMMRRLTQAHDEQQFTVSEHSQTSQMQRDAQHSTSTSSESHYSMPQTPNHRRGMPVSIFAIANASISTLHSPLSRGI